MESVNEGLAGKKRSAERVIPRKTSRNKRKGNDSAGDLQHHEEKSKAGRQEENAFASLEALLTRESRTVQSAAQKSVPSSPSSLSSTGTSDSPQAKMATGEKPQYDVAMNNDARDVGTPRRLQYHCAQTTTIKTNLSAKKIPRVSHATMSIVGSRPRHWTKGKSTSNPKRRGFAEPNRHKRQARLEAELNRPPATSPLPSTSRGHPSRTNLLPTFLSRDIAPEEDAIQEATDDLVGSSDRTTARSPSPVPVTPKRSSKKGALAKRMQALRDSVKGDQIRLQSGQYPFSLRSTDRNDPRNRATSTASVTVLGTPVQLQRQVISALCYLHEWQSTGAPAAGDAALTNTPPPKSLVWAIFGSGSTQPKGQLRLYNVIAMPCNDKWVLFHTDVREPYPEQLPALGPVPAVSPLS